jgi:hypothetical protein
VALTTQFDGDALPAGWSAFTPNGSSVTVDDGWLQFGIPAAQTFDTIFSGGGINTAICAYHAVPTQPGGAFDWAIQISDDISDTKQWGIHLLACDVDGEDNSGGGWFRWGFFRPNTNTEFAQFFAASRPAGSGTTTGGTNHITGSNTNTLTESQMSGVPVWPRLSFNGTDQWSCRYSPDGGGNWYTQGTFTRAFTPTRLLIAVTSAVPQTAGTIRVASSHDLLALGATDLRTAKPERERERILLYQAGDPLPAELNDDSAGGDSVVAGGTGLVFTTSAPTVDSRARLVWDGERSASMGMLLRIKGGTFTGGSTFSTFGLLQDLGLVGGDPYVRLGGGYGVERGATITRPIRVDNPQGSNVASVVGTTGLDEKRYAWMRSVSGQPTLNSAAADIWLRMERLWVDTGGQAWWSVSEWNEGQAEPGTWNIIDAQDDTERISDLGPSLALTHNNPVTPPTGGAVLTIPYLEVYLLVEPEPEPEPDPGGWSHPTTNSESASIVYWADDRDRAYGEPTRDYFLTYEDAVEAAVRLEPGQLITVTQPGT